MTKNIVVGLDGTWNEPEIRSDGTATGTNVVIDGGMTRRIQF